MSEAASQHSKQVWEKFWDEKKEIEDVYSNSDRIIRQLESLEDVRGKYIMEIGAGSGRDGFRLVDAGAKVFLLDYASSSLQVMKELSKKYDKQVFLVKGDAFHLPVKTDRLDVVFHQGLLEHFTNPQDILAENYRVLKPGGFALADVPQKYHPYTVVKHILIWLNKWFAGWETEFSRRHLERLFQDVGFRIHTVYGDWMRPSFFYRALREVLKKIGIKLPLYPKGIPILRDIRRVLRQWFKKSALSFYTYMDIGVIGKK